MLASRPWARRAWLVLVPSWAELHAPPSYAGEQTRKQLGGITGFASMCGVSA